MDTGTKEVARQLAEELARPQWLEGNGGTCNREPGGDESNQTDGDGEAEDMEIDDENNNGALHPERNSDALNSIQEEVHGERNDSGE